MGFFGSDKSYLGVDLGAVSTKMVELRNEKGRPQLVSYGFIEEAVDLVHGNSPEIKDRAVGFLKQIYQQAHFNTTKAIAALPTYSVFSSIVNLPNVAKKDLPSTIHWEAKKVIPLPLEEMILDWKVLPAESQAVNQPAKQNNQDRVVNTKNGNKGMRVLLTGAPKNLVKKFVEVFQKAGLNLISLETESFALIRSLVGNDKSTIMIIDFGGLTTNISVVESGIPVLNRSLEVGGASITKAIADSLNINLNRAEQFKRDVGISLDNSGGNEVPKTIESSLSPIINEIKYCFSLYQNQVLGSDSQTDDLSGALFSGRIEKIILTGGSAMLPQLSSYLSQLLDIKVFLGDPWARVSHPVELKPVLQEIGSRFSVVLGLAMRDIE